MSLAEKGSITTVFCSPSEFQKIKNKRDDVKFYLPSGPGTTESDFSELTSVRLVILGGVCQLPQHVIRRLRSEQGGPAGLLPVTRTVEEEK